MKLVADGSMEKFTTPSTELCGGIALKAPVMLVDVALFPEELKICTRFERSTAL